MGTPPYHDPFKRDPDKGRGEIMVPGSLSPDPVDDF